jgi:hypothetical protein
MTKQWWRKLKSVVGEFTRFLPPAAGEGKDRGQ